MPTIDDTETTARPTSSEMRAPASSRDEDVAPELVEAEGMRRGSGRSSRRASSCAAGS